MEAKGDERAQWQKWQSTRCCAGRAVVRVHPPRPMHCVLSKRLEAVAQVGERPSESVVELGLRKWLHLDKSTDLYQYW